MGTAVWHPPWWTQEQHESNWDRVKEALRRDWEQTKVDLQGHGKDLNQDFDDTVKQAVGKEVIPPGTEANVKHLHNVTRPVWRDVEEPVRYGVGARQQYGATHKAWDDKLEGTLKSEWETASEGSHGTWDAVKAYVRHGYERVTS